MVERPGQLWLKMYSDYGCWSYCWHCYDQMWYVARFGTICTILKNVRNTYGGVLLLVKLRASACNFTKNKFLPWVFLMFFKLYKWYQIVQRITDEFVVCPWKIAFQRQILYRALVSIPSVTCCAGTNWGSMYTWYVRMMMHGLKIFLRCVWPFFNIMHWRVNVGNFVTSI